MSGVERIVFGWGCFGGRYGKRRKCCGCTVRKERVGGGGGGRNGGGGGEGCVLSFLFSDMVIYFVILFF